MTGSDSDNSTQPMTSSRPYIVKALHEWIVDNHMTPYLLVNAMNNDVMVPERYIDNGKIVLNINPMAVNVLAIEKSHIEFEARFRGIVEHVFVPMQAVLAIYAKENGRGMAFEDDDGDIPPPPPKDEGGKSSGGKGGSGARGHLKVVK